MSPPLLVDRDDGRASWLLGARSEGAFARLVLVQFLDDELDEVVDADSGQFSKFLSRLECCRGHPEGAASVLWQTHSG